MSEGESQHRIKKRRKGNKLKQNFERNPPRCGNCDNFRSPAQAVPGGKPYQPAWCKLGAFRVEPVSICDSWKRGNETIEAA